LTSFNKTFSENTCESRETLQGVNDSYSSQFELIQEINKLKIRSITTANIEVYEKLKSCTDDFLFLVVTFGWERDGGDNEDGDREPSAGEYNRMLGL
jgi:hypothetical protein